MALVATLLLGLVPAWAANSPVSQDPGGLALQGYDAVAYHAEGKPVMGRSEFETEWNGARWRFASAQNRDAFALPVNRLPPFGCSACGWSRP